jgi:hypothetical protein
MASRQEEEMAFAIAPPLSKTCWIVCPKARANLPKLVAFREWLLSEASKDERQLQALPAPLRRGRSRQRVDAKRNRPIARQR